MRAYTLSVSVFLFLKSKLEKRICAWEEKTKHSLHATILAGKASPCPTLVGSGDYFPLGFSAGECYYRVPPQPGEWITFYHMGN